MITLPFIKYFPEELEKLAKPSDDEEMEPNLNTFERHGKKMIAGALGAGAAAIGYGKYKKWKKTQPTQSAPGTSNFGQFTSSGPTPRSDDMRREAAKTQKGLRTLLLDDRSKPDFGSELKQRVEHVMDESGSKPSQAASTVGGEARKAQKAALKKRIEKAVTEHFEGASPWRKKPNRGGGMIHIPNKAKHQFKGVADILRSL